jgi:HTH-type transcriptional regulator/antitoxin HigA
MSDAPQISTESDYQAALAELAQLWGAKSGTPEGDRLDLLATLIDAYEDLHEPMGVAISDRAKNA